MKATIITDMPAAEYHALPHISNSFLTAWKTNALKAIYQKKNGRPITDALEFGTMAHCALLEPERFAKTYHGLPKLDKRKTKDKEIYEAACAKYGEENLMSEEERLALVRMGEAVRGHEKVWNLLQLATVRELVILWTDSEGDDATGLECKCRIDMMGGPIICDLKSTLSASTLTFPNEIRKYGYHRQGAMYDMACKAAGLDVPNYMLIPIEKAEPFGVNVLSIPDSAINLGKYEVRKLMKKVAHWKETGKVPGYSDKVESVDLDEWYYRQIEAEGA